MNVPALAVERCVIKLLFLPTLLQSESPKILIIILYPSLRVERYHNGHE